MEVRIGRHRPGANVAPAFIQYRSRTDRHCEHGCGRGIAKGDTYRQVKSNGQRICLPCWAESWPRT
ncbi:hypothetical protein [Kribbella solani]|uniref:Uncharacterized protein n=1 Tax=Kribbella solani TaxID=236067 RepID=A0A841DTY6_9ACTN|nr:hypothetical protein [Kribbella solani]MBB5980345.1 hypothetical protein [Kribbella solani]